MNQSHSNKDENLKLIKRWIEAANAHDPEQIGETLHDDYEYDIGNTSLKGRQEAIKEWKIFFEGFPDLKYEAEQIVTGEDYAIARLRMTGTQKGPFRFIGTHSFNDPIPASNKSIDIPSCGYYKIKDGKIIQLQRYWDTGTLLRQIGINFKW